jgi:perosamine synthetase
MNNERFVQAVVAAIRSVLPKGQAPVALHEPLFRGNEWSYVKECIDTGWVSSVGRYVDKFEEMLADITGARRAVAVVNGTAALQICLRLVGVLPNDEVLVPALSFVATANAVVYCNAVPHFVDSEERTLGLDPYKLDMYLREIGDVRSDGCYNRITGRRIKAVVPMHTFGHPVDLDPLIEVCERFKLELVEDAAESLGSYYKGKHTGTFGKAAALSFNGNKIATTGGGGAILTNDPELGKMAKHLTTTAKVPHAWEFIHDQVGYNYRMPNVNAALGYAQLEQLPRFIDSKRKLAERYLAAFESLEGIEAYREPVFARSNYWLNVLILKPEHADLRDPILEATHQNGMMTRPVWKLLDSLGIYGSCPSMDVSTAKSLEKRIINIPSGAALGGTDVEA